MASELEKAVEASHTVVIEAREPIVQDMLDKLASELLEADSKAARLRARLYGFSVCSQKLPSLARDLLSRQPKSTTLPQTNSPAARVSRKRKRRSKLGSWRLKAMRTRS
jgi:hypothetical protein